MVDKPNDAADDPPKRAGLSAGQRRSMLWIYWAYVLCYLCRKNYPLLLPSLGSSGLLTTAQAGVVASTFEAVVGLVKLFCGVYVDRHLDPAKLLSQCLAVAGGSCLLMQAALWFVRGQGAAATLRVTLVAVFWSANGAGQAVAWPALARVFMNWFPEPSVRGFWYSILSTNQNVGGTLAPRLLPPFMQSFGWASALYGPALLTLGYGGAQALSLRSGPPCPPADQNTRQKPPPELDSPPRSPNLSPQPSPRREEMARETLGAAATAASPMPAPAPDFAATFVHLFRMRPFLLLCGGYIPVMLMRTSLANWTAVMFQMQGLGVAAAASCISMLEAGGFFGGLCGGWLSDRLYKGRRGPVMCIYSLVCAPLSLILQATIRVPSSGSSWLARVVALPALFFLHGFFSFPPHSLIGLTAREIAPPSMCGGVSILKAALESGPYWLRFYLCHACYYHEIDDANALVGARPPAAWPKRSGSLARSWPAGHCSRWQCARAGRWWDH
jgi:sugar phosphate permease